MLYHSIAQSLTHPDAETGAFSALTDRTDLARYKPQAVQGVAEEQIREGDQDFTVIRSPKGAYLRLTPAQRSIWRQMDGTRTVAQLATAAFLEFKQLLPVGDLVEALRGEGFLLEQPVGVYRALHARLEDRTAEGWGKRILQLLSGRRLELRNIDPLYGAIYRWVGWLLFTPLFVGAWFAVALAGCAAFVWLLITRSTAAGVDVPWAMAALIAAVLLSFLLHESAHALAVKHFRRRLGGGGVMLYWGLPAFYVDTSDIWPSPRRARVLVSAAGPMSDLFIGGLASCFTLLQPASPLVPVATTLAFTCYISTLANANPLLELDGYYILVDLLRLPDLRRRALAFVRGPLWERFARRRTTDDRRPTESSSSRPSSTIRRLSDEERIFTLYGLLTLIYGVVAAWFAWQFWQRWLWSLIVQLWVSESFLNQLVAAVLVFGVVVPVLFGLGALAVSGVRATVGWLIRHGYGRRPEAIAGICAAVVLALALLLGRDGGPWYLALLPPLLWVVATVALALTRPDYVGATIFPAFNALLPATVLAGVAALAQSFVPGLWWQVAAGAGLLFVLLAAFFAQLDVNVRMAPPRVQLSAALMLMLAFAVGGFVLLERLNVVGNQVVALALAAPAYFGALALALLLPYLFSLNGSRLFWSWALLWAAMLAETAAYIVDMRAPSLGLDLLAAGLWAAAWLAHLATLRQITPTELPWSQAENIGERERLQRAFQLCYAGCYRLLHDVYGPRRTRELDDRMDVLAATANWGVRLDRELAEVDRYLATQPLDVQGARFAEVLRYTIATIEDLAGVAFARRTIQAAYDALPWPERETASRLCFPDTPWARDLSSKFGDVKYARLRLLRDVDALLGCDDEELAALIRSAQQQTVAAGQLLLREGEPVTGVWVVEAGEIIGRSAADSAEQELHRANMFGYEETVAQQSAARSYRASIDSSVLFVPAADFQALVHTQLPQADPHAETVRLLERVPLFAQLPRAALRRLAEVAQRQQFAARDVVIRQGVPSGMFYLIESGRAAVLARDNTRAGEKATLIVLARLGREEFFGELELLDGSPPRAHVVAETALSVLAIPHAVVRTQTLGNAATKRDLEQISTARLRAVKR